MTELLHTASTLFLGLSLGVVACMLVAPTDDRGTLKAIAISGLSLLVSMACYSAERLIGR